jgi:hypothetical protein
VNKEKELLEQKTNNEIMAAKHQQRTSLTYFA